MTACHCSVARISRGMTKWFEVCKNIKGPLFIQGHGQMGSGVWQSCMKAMVVWKREWMKPKLEQYVATKTEHCMKKKRLLDQHESTKLFLSQLISNETVNIGKLCWFVVFPFRRNN